VVPRVTEEHRAFYEALVRHEILQVWTSFLDYYWKECSKNNVPLLMVRYEDLVLKPRDELQRILEFCCGCSKSGDRWKKLNFCCGGSNNDDWWKKRLEEVTGDTSSETNTVSTGEKQKEGGGQRGSPYKYGYRSSSSAADDSVETKQLSAVGSPGVDKSSPTVTLSSATSDNMHDQTGLGSSWRSTHPSIGRSLRRGLFPPGLLKMIHDFDDLPSGKIRPGEMDGSSGKWLERLGYHVYKQGFPNNLDNLPPVPVLECTTNGRVGVAEESSSVVDGDSSIVSPSLAINVKDVSLELRPRDSPYGRNMRRWRRERTARDTEPFPTI
jgi:hypothetical protein